MADKVEKKCKHGCPDRGDGCIHNWHPVVWGVVIKDGKSTNNKNDPNTVK